MSTQKRVISNTAAAVIVCIFVVFVAGLIFYSGSSKQGSFLDRDPRRIVEIPRSWGKPVSICRRPLTVTILFENGHVITVAHGFIGLSGRYFYTVQIVYVDDSS